MDIPQGGTGAVLFDGEKEVASAYATIPYGTNNDGEFWGPMNKVEGSNVLQMSPAEYVY